jgi:signal transduction histidine kinase
MAPPTSSRLLRWAFIAASIVLVADVLVCLLSVHRFFQDIEFAERSDAFLEQVNNTLALAKDAEAGQRGYLLTGDEQFLEPYRVAMHSLDEQLVRLIQQTQTTGIFGDFRDQVARYEQLVRENLRSLATVIEARREGRLSGLDTFYQGKQLMDEVRAQAARLIAADRAGLAARNEEALGNLHWTYGSFAGAAVLNLLLLGVLWWTVQCERAARTEAERANRLKDEFLATLSHELRTPIHAVLGWTAVLSDERFNDLKEIRRGLKVIEQNAEAQAQLVEELLDLSRIVAGQLRLECQPVDMVPVIQAAMATVQVAAQQKGVRLKAALASEVSSVRGDPARLQQVVWNLLTNAIKFTPAGGEVEVVLQETGGRIELAVRDNGIGIKPEVLPHLFQRFRQGDSSLTRRYGGLGIGLALVKSLVGMQGGSVEARSPGEGQGATFTVSLPLADSAPALSHLTTLWRRNPTPTLPQQL